MKLILPNAARDASSATSDAPLVPRSMEDNGSDEYPPRIRTIGCEQHAPTEVRIGPFAEPLNIAQKQLIDGAIREAEFRGYGCVKITSVDPETKWRHVTVTIVVPREVRKTANRGEVLR